MIYDAAIIGTGPAGLSAALNLKIHQKSFLWFGTPELSQKISRAEKIDNYPGFSSVSGAEMADAFRAQIRDMEIEIKDSMINSIMYTGEHYALLAASDFYEAKALILATGVAPASTIAGEDKFLGRGVSYCATCDGNLYRGKTIAVLCTNKRFEHEVKYLAGLAKKIYFFPYYKDVSDISENTEQVMAKISSINGEGRVNGITLGNGRMLEVNGLFCLREAISLSTLLPGLESENGHIKIARDGSTNLEGVFAAGDCTGRPYQYAKAVGEGNIAAHSVIEYLDKI